ncbi:MAG: hypothetical protein AAGI12_15595 [Pseudomonadota bacterium]
MPKKRYGITNYAGPAVDRCKQWLDNNHSKKADEKSAIANLNSMEEDFVSMQNAIYQRLRQGK